MVTSEMTPADIAAVTNNGSGSGGFGGWGGDWSAWIIIFLIFAAFGWGNNGNGGGFFGGGSQNTVADGYTLASDFATIQRQLSDGFNGIDNALDRQNAGICDLGYTQAQLINGVQQNVMTQGYETRNAISNLSSQMAQCCCDIREGISGVNYNLATQVNGLSREVERGFCDTNYNMATQHAQTIQAVDKVGDRIIDYLANKENQNLRDDNFALRLAASQQAQNAYIVDKLGYHCPQPAYVVQPPQQVTFPTNCCGTVNYANYSGGCGCN